MFTFTCKHKLTNHLPNIIISIIIITHFTFFWTKFKFFKFKIKSLLEFITPSKSQLETLALKNNNDRVIRFNFPSPAGGKTISQLKFNGTFLTAIFYFILSEAETILHVGKIYTFCYIFNSPYNFFILIQSLNFSLQLHIKNSNLVLQIKN